MTNQQLNKTKIFSKPFYKNAGKYHDWSHILSVRKNISILIKDHKEARRNILYAACYLHDIGRCKKDKNHAEESAILAKPFLKKINVKENEIEDILHSIRCHDINKIHEAKIIEAKLLFDADKLEILTVFGFIRVCTWLIEEREMELAKAVNFLWKFAKRARKNCLYSRRAKTIADKEMELIIKLVKYFNKWNSPSRFA